MPSLPVLHANDPKPFKQILNISRVAIKEQQQRSPEFLHYSLLLPAGSAKQEMMIFFFFRPINTASNSSIHGV